MIKYALALLLALTMNAQAASTGTLLLQGTVAASCNIAITPNGSNNTTLDIVNGESNKLVAAGVETCNNATGYKINVKSDNAGELRHGVTPSLKTTYTLIYDGQSITPTTNYQQVKNVSVLNAPANTSSEIRVNVTALPNAMAGTYSDTVTVQIVANP